MSEVGTFTNMARRQRRHLGGQRRAGVDFGDCPAWILSGSVAGTHAATPASAGIRPRRMRRIGRTGLFCLATIFARSWGVRARD